MEVYPDSHARTNLPGLGARVNDWPGGQRFDLDFLGILAYLIIEYTRLPMMFPVLQNFHVAKVAVGVSALGLLMSAGPRNKDSSMRKIDACLLFFMVATLIAAFFANYSQAAWGQCVDSAKWVAVCFLISRIVVSPWRSKVFVLIFLLLNLKLAQFAIRLYLQYGTMEQGGHSVAMVGLGGNDFFGNSNDFGVGMSIVLPLAGSLFLGESKIFSRIIYFATSLGVFVAMLLSGCRGAFLATCVAGVVFLVRGKRKILALVMAFLVVGGALIILPTGNLDRLRSAFHPENDQTAIQRIGFWKAGFQMFLDHPVTGVGPGNFAPTFRDHFGGTQRDPGAWAPHSIYIQGFAELGLLGAIPLFVLWVLASRINSGTRRLLATSGADPQCFEMRLALGLELSLIAFLVSGAFLTTLYYPHLWFILGMSVGLRRACNEKILRMGEGCQEGLEDEVALATG